MPTKVATETQLLRLLANTPLQINVDFLYMASHESKNTAAEHFGELYKTLRISRIITMTAWLATGAPVRLWKYRLLGKLTQVFEWSKRCLSTLHLVGGAQAGLYRYRIQKVELCDKLSVSMTKQWCVPSLLMRGFDVASLPSFPYTDIPLKEVLERAIFKWSRKEMVGLSIIASPAAWGL